MASNLEKRAPGVYSQRFELPPDADHPYRRQRRHTFRGTRAEAEKHFRAIQRDIDRARYVDKNDVTLQKLLREWIKVHGPRLGPKTRERYEEIIERHLIPELGRIRVQQLKAGRINEYLSEKRESGRLDGKGGLSEKTLLSIFGVLSKAMSYAVKVNYLGHHENPCARVERPKPNAPEIVYLTSEEMFSLCEKARGDRLFIPILLGCHTGMRRGEVLALKWSDIDLERGRLSVARALYETKSERGEKQTKTETGKRSITLTPFVINELRAHKREQNERRMASKTWVNRDLVCADENGDWWWPSNFTSAFRRFVDALPELPPVHFHGLRHSHATDLLSRREHLRVVQERLGHKNIETTAKTYSHVTQSMQDDMALRQQEEYERWRASN